MLANKNSKFAFAAVSAIGISLLIRRLYPHMPCPSSLSFLLENPFMNRVAGPELLLDRAVIKAGMHVLDAGCGPGRLTLPAARRVGPNGLVVALDIQPAMLDRLNKKLSEQKVTNVRPLLAGLGEGKTKPGSFDRVLLVTVLGEIPDKTAALREIYQALKPGGILSITEVFPDPDIQLPDKIRQLARETGFVVSDRYGRFPAYTMNLLKPI